MNSETLIPTLALATLVIVLVLAVVQFGAFLRKRRNRDIASHALGLDDDGKR